MVNVDEWVDAVEREFLYSGSNFESSSTPKGTASTGYSRKRTNTGAGDSTLPRSSRNHRAHVNVGRMPLRDSGGASTTGWTATDEDGILTPPGSSTVGEGFYF